jgi:hypothetical protein
MWHMVRAAGTTAMTHMAAAGRVRRVKMGDIDLGLPPPLKNETCYIASVPP